MRKVLLSWLVMVFAAAVILPVVKAQSLGGYTFDTFESNITIQKNTKLLVEEKIELVFSEYRHGIYRYIPTVYRNGAKMLNAHIRILSVSDEKGHVPFSVTFKGNNLELKIGDANKTVIGKKNYVIDYEVSNMISRQNDQDELNWNVTGSGWDVNTNYVWVLVKSPNAKIIKTDCFAGETGTALKNCVTDAQDNNVAFSSQVPVGHGRDMTVVIGLDKNNGLVFPTLRSQIMDQITLRWYYVLVFIPAIFTGLEWWRRGRDQKDAYGNYLEYVYAPIKGITPAQAGVLADQKVHVPDLTAEILELARLKYLEIKKAEDNYVFIKLKESDGNLKNYQQALMAGIFEKLHMAGAEPSEQVSGKEASLSVMKQTFYPEYQKFKEQVSQDVSDNGWFDGSPEKVRMHWTAWISIVIFVLLWLGVKAKLAGDMWLDLSVVLSAAITYAFGYAMPRRTLEGFKLYRQLEGLKYYINEGKWRYENFEKNLFIEEILPLAVALGVVDKITAQMKELGMQPPQYANAMGANLMYWHSFNNAVSPLSQNPSRQNGWSGGSGFSGGFSGGGGGGGGGGSW